MYIDFVVIFTVLLDLPYIILLILMGVELLFRVYMLPKSKSARTCFLETSLV